MKKLLSLLVLTGTLFAQANNIFTLNPSVNSAGMGNVGIANAEVKNVFHILQKLYNEGYKNVVMVVGQDRLR